jgi:hypothetical protein
VANTWKKNSNNKIKKWIQVLFLLSLYDMHMQGPGQGCVVLKSVVSLLFVFALTVIFSFLLNFKVELSVQTCFPVFLLLCQVFSPSPSLLIPSMKTLPQFLS